MILIVSLTARPVVEWTFLHSHSPNRSFGAGCFIPFLPTPSLPLLWPISFYAFPFSGLSSPWGFPISPPKFVCGIIVITAVLNWFSLLFSSSGM